MKGTQTVKGSPDHKALFLGGRGMLGVGWPVKLIEQKWWGLENVSPASNMASFWVSMLVFSGVNLEDRIPNLPVIPPEVLLFWVVLCFGGSK